MNPKLPILLLVAGGILSACSNGTASTTAQSAPPPPTVTIAPVEARDIAETAEFSGRLGAIDDVEVRPRVSGHVDRVHFQAGQIVQRGDVLFTIDARGYQATLAAAEAAVLEAQVRAANANKEAERASTLLGSRAISTEESESRTARQAEAGAALVSAQATRDLAQLDVEYTRVVAPVTGRVSRALVTQGNLVSGIPAANTLLTTIVSVDPMFVYVDVDENTLLRLQKLMRANELPHDEQGRVKVEVGLTDEEGFPRSGVVESLGNRVEAGTGSILMRVVVPNPDGLLLPGLFTRVRMPTTAKQPTILVNQRAIGTDQSQKFVYVVGASKTAERRPITIGPVVDGKRVVRTGLTADDHVIVNGLQRVRPGSPVTPELEKPAAEGQSEKSQPAAH